MNKEQQYFIDRTTKTPDGCWLWNNYINPKGYGSAGGINNWLSKIYRKTLVHQLSYIVFKGPIPDGLVVRHKCRNRHCCNPEHLEVGTMKDNADDRKRDGTSVGGRGNNKGEINGCSKLTEADVLEIRRLYASHQLNQRELAEHYNVSQTIISALILRKTWKHV